MPFISAGVRSTRGQRLTVIAFLFALPTCLVAADQSPIVAVDSNPLQRKDFLKQFSAKDLFNQPSAGDLTKLPPSIFLAKPDSAVIAEVLNGRKQCSIPLLEKRVQRSFDTRGVIKIPNSHFDGMSVHAPAPTCKNWNEKGR